MRICPLGFKGLIVNCLGCPTSTAHLPWIVPEILQNDISRMFWTGLEHFCQASWRKSHKWQYKHTDFTFSAIEKTWWWKRKIEKWDGFHQYHHYCPSAVQPRKWNPKKVNLSNTPTWNSTGTSWKGFYYFYKIPLVSFKYLRKHLDMALCYTSNVHSHKKISRYFLRHSVVLRIFKIYLLFLSIKLIYNKLGLMRLCSEGTLQAATTFIIYSKKKDTRLKIILCKQEICFPFIKKMLDNTL